MKNLLALSFLALLLHSNLLFAVVKDEQSINQLNEIVTYIRNNLPLDENGRVTEETVVALDWDLVIIKKRVPVSGDCFTGDEVFADDVVMESGEHGTLETILELHKMGVKTMVLTNRGNGIGLNGGQYNKLYQYDSAMADKFFRTHVDSFNKVLGSKEGLLKSWNENGALKKVENDDFHEEELLEHELVDEYYSDLETPPSQIVTKEQFAFGGVNCSTFPHEVEVKGRVLEQLIDNNRFIKKPKNLLFVDDLDVCINNVNFVFKQDKRSGQDAYLFKFPNPDRD